MLNVHFLLLFLSHQMRCLIFETVKNLAVICLKSFRLRHFFWAITCVSQCCRPSPGQAINHVFWVPVPLCRSVPSSNEFWVLLCVLYPPWRTTFVTNFECYCVCHPLPEGLSLYPVPFWSLDPVPFWSLDPGSGIGLSRIPVLGSRIQNPYFWELSDNFLGKKFYNSLKTGPNFFLQRFKTIIIFNFVKCVAT